MGIILIVRQHHRETVSQREIIPRKVKALPAFVRPDGANARPDFLPGLVFARVPAVIEDVGWCVWHRNVVSDHRGSNSQVIDFESVKIYPIFTIKIENPGKSNT